MSKTELDQLLELRISEKLQLVEDLWDSIAGLPEQVPVHDWHKQELSTRKDRHSKNPGSTVPWEEAKERIRRRRA